MDAISVVTGEFDMQGLGLCLEDSTHAMASYMKDLICANEVKILRKVGNVRAKMEGPSSIQNISLDDNPTCSKKIGNLTIQEGMYNLHIDPWLVAYGHYAWSWHQNCWPWAGVSCLLRPAIASFCVKLINIGVLRKAGMSSLPALAEYLQTVRDLKKTYEVKADCVVLEGQVLFIPLGMVPVATGLPPDNGDVNAASSIAMVVSIVDLAAARKVNADEFEEIVVNINHGVTRNSGTKTWSNCVGKLQKWTDLVETS